MSNQVNNFPLFIVINEYHRRMDDELDMKPGDKVQVITDDQEFNDGWYYGKNLRTGFEGLYPKCFTQEISVSNNSPSLMRNKSTRRIASPAFSGSNVSLDLDYSNNNNNSPQVNNLSSQSPHMSFQRNFSNLSQASHNSSSANSPYSHNNGYNSNGNTQGNNLYSNSNTNSSSNLKANGTSSSTYNSYAINGNTGGSTLSLLNGATKRFSRLLSSNSNHSTTESTPPPSASVPSHSTSNFSSGSGAESRNKMINNTLNDIDRAIEELKFTPDQNTGGNRDLLFETINGSNLKTQDCGNWSADQVAAHFKTIGLDRASCIKFVQHKITGRVLLELEMIHLKQELDIASFGTRYEVFKEIENLKQIWNANSSNREQPERVITPSNIRSAKRNSFLMPAASLANTNASSSVELPTPREKNHISRPLSLVLPKEDQTTPLMNNEDFASPRKAPQPPAYPSPAQPPKSPDAAFIKRSTSTFTQRTIPSPYGNIQHNIDSNVSQKLKMFEKQMDSPSPMEQKRRGSHHRRTSSISPTSVGVDELVVEKNSRRSSVSNAGVRNYHSSSNLSSESPYYKPHKRTASGSSFIDLFNRLDSVQSNSNHGNFSDRPTSSIYEHSRNSSVQHSRKPSYTHSRNASYSRQFNNPSVATTSATTTSATGATNPTFSSRRNSMLSLFKGSNNNNNGTSAISTPVVDKKRSASVPSKTDENSFKESSNLLDSFAEGQKNGNHSSSDLKTVKHESNSTATGISLNQETPMSNTTHMSTIVSASSQSAVSTIPAQSEERRTISDSQVKNSANSNSTGQATMSKPELQNAFSSSAINIKNKSKKKNTSAFQDGMRNITVQESMKDAACFGWMSKKGASAVGVWKNRFFILHGTRLSYFDNTTATKERGLIDITAHKVLPTRDDDRLVSFYAATTGKGRYCFKIVPPAPGSKKGLTFTQQKVHYFAVETKEEMRQWMAALIKATIDIDTSVPIISSCATPTVSLSKAQEMLDQARKETQQREYERRMKEEGLPSGSSNGWESQQRYITPDAQNKEGSNDLSPSSGFESPYMLASGTFGRDSMQSPDHINNNVDNSFAFGSSTGDDSGTFSNATYSSNNYTTDTTAPASNYSYRGKLDPKYGNKL